MLNDKKMPDYFWTKVVPSAVYIMNSYPTISIHAMTSKEDYTNRRLDIMHLKVFGCIAYVHVPNERRTKMDPKAKKCIFIRYSLHNRKGTIVMTLPFTRCK